MSKDNYLEYLSTKGDTGNQVLEYESKFEDLQTFIRLQYLDDKISEDAYEYIWNAIYDLIEIFYKVGGIEI